MNCPACGQYCGHPAGWYADDLEIHLLASDDCRIAIESGAVGGQA